MVCPPVPAILNLDQSDQEQDESETDESGNLDEAEDTRSACLLPVRAMQCNAVLPFSTTLQACDMSNDPQPSDDGTWQNQRQS